MRRSTDRELVYASAMRARPLVRSWPTATTGRAIQPIPGEGIHHMQQQNPALAHRQNQASAGSVGPRFGRTQISPLGTALVAKAARLRPPDAGDLQLSRPRKGASWRRRRRGVCGVVQGRSPLGFAGGHDDTAPARHFSSLAVPGRDGRRSCVWAWRGLGYQAIVYGSVSPAGRPGVKARPTGVAWPVDRFTRYAYGPGAVKRPVTRA